MKQILHRLGLASLVASMTLASLACGSNSSGGAGGNAGGSGSGAGGSGDAGTCPARPDLIAAAPACNNVVNAANAIPFTPGTGTLPAPTGGAILDGRYEATRTEAFGTTTGNGRRITFVILEGATRMLWAGEVLDATGTTVVTSFRADSTISVTGTQINVVADCVSSTPSPLPSAFGYTVSGSNLILSVTSPTMAATTYTRRGCAQ